MLLCRAHKLLDQYLAISDSNAHGTIRGNFEPQSPGKTTVSTLPWARWLTVAAPHLNCIDRVSFVHFAQLQSRGNFRAEATSDPRQLQTRGFRREGLRNLRNLLRDQTPCARQSKWHGSW